MRIYLILNLIMAVLIFGIIFAYDYEESSNWLLFLTLALSVFFNLKIIANIRKYWNSRKNMTYFYNILWLNHQSLAYL